MLFSGAASLSAVRRGSAVAAVRSAQSAIGISEVFALTRTDENVVLVRSGDNDDAPQRHRSFTSACLRFSAS